MKNFEETLTYRAEKYLEVLDELDFHRIKLVEKVEELAKWQKEIELWKPKQN